MRFANRVFREHFGEPDGRPCYEILRGRSQPCEDCSSGEVLTSQSPQESQWTSPSGRVYQIYGYPFADVDGSSLVLKIGIDITEQRRAEEALYREREIPHPGGKIAPGNLHYRTKGRSTSTSIPGSWRSSVTPWKIFLQWQRVVCPGLPRSSLSAGGDLRLGLRTCREFTARRSQATNFHGRSAKTAQKRS